MQRKIYFLNKAHKKGFILIYAIALIVLISTVLVMSLNLSSESSKRTSNRLILRRHWMPSTNCSL